MTNNTPSKIKNTIKKYVQNSETFIGVLDDLVYSFVLRAFLGEMMAVLYEEETGLKTLGNDETAIEMGQSEIEKLRVLINELEPLLVTDDNEIKEVIRNRFMS